MKWQAHMTPELQLAFPTLIPTWTLGRRRFGFRLPLATGLRASVLPATGESRGGYQRERLIPILCASGMTTTRLVIGRGHLPMTCRLLISGKHLRQ